MAVQSDLAAAQPPTLGNALVQLWHQRCSCGQSPDAHHLYHFGCSAAVVRGLGHDQADPAVVPDLGQDQAGPAVVLCPCAAALNAVA